MKKVSCTTMKDWIGLFIALAVSALFLVFCIPLYELMYYDTDFATEMYESNMYFLCAAYTVGVVWLICILYYLIIDHFNRWWQWLIALLLSILLAPSVVFMYSDNYFAEENIDFSTQLANFNIVSGVIACILFISTSICIKSLSTNCSTTPF